MGGIQVVTNQPTIAALNQAQWYAIQTRPRHEKRVVAELNERQVLSYLPLMNEVHHWTDRRKVVQVPLFPGYVFINAQLDAAVRLSIVRISGVFGFVGTQREAVPIPGSQIEEIRTLLSKNVTLTPYPFLKVGQRVRIRGGALDGIEGILITNGKRHLVISVESIQRSLSLTIEGYDVEPA